MKYIRFDPKQSSPYDFIVWNEETPLHHSRLAPVVTSWHQTKIISAGFVYWSELEGKFICHGNSESLGVSSLEEDTELFNKWIMGV